MEAIFILCSPVGMSLLANAAASGPLMAGTTSSCPLRVTGREQTSVSGLAARRVPSRGLDPRHRCD
jgi:hypothetical protein